MALFCNRFTWPPLSYVLTLALYVHLHAQHEEFSFDLWLETELVAGCIDPVSGAFLDQETDIEIPQAGNLKVERYHNSRRMQEREIYPTHCIDKCRTRVPGELFHAWHWNHATAAYHITHDRQLNIKSIQGQDVLYESNGLALGGFVHDSHFKHWTNSRSGRLAAVLDLHNSKAHRACDRDPWTVTEPNGVRRIFGGVQNNSIWKKGRFSTVRAESERFFPNGLKWIYKHENPMCMAGVQALARNGYVIGTLFFQKVDTHVYELQGSTGDWVRYTINKEDSPYVYDQTPAKVERSQRPTVTYNYLLMCLDGRCCFHKIGCKNYPDGRYRRIEYVGHYVDKVMADGFEKMCKKKYRDQNYWKVHSYHGPGSQGQEVQLYSFQYENNQTTVKDALGRKIIYSFDESARPSSIDYFDSSNNFQLKRHMTWSKSPVEGRLTRHWITDSSKLTPVVKNCDYDEFGNVTTETTWTRLSRSSAYPKVDEVGHVLNANEVDTYQTHYEYGPAPFYLKLAHVHANGRRESYLYEPDSNRLKAHLISFNGHILERHFFEYDYFGEPCIEISDDGSGHDVNSLADVHERTIKSWLRYMEGPSVGLLQREEISYCDPSTGAIVPLSSTSYTYDKKRHVTSKKICDLVTGLEIQHVYKHDDHGNLVYESTPRGACINRSYDANDNMVYQQGPLPNVEMHFSYDLNNQLKEKRTIYPDGEWKESYSYDDMGQLVQKIDPYGIEETLSYDFAGRIVRKSIKGLLDEELHVSSKPYVSTYQYDGLNHKIKEVDERGFSTSYIYNGCDQLLYQKSPEGSTTSFSYDSKGFLVSKKYDSRWNEEFIYDALGRLCEIYRVAGPTRTCIQKNSYQQRQLVSRVDALGHEDRWGYDGAGRKIWHERHDGQTGQISREEWSYTGLNQVSCHRQWQNSTDYIEEVVSYDVAGELSEKFHRNCLGRLQGHEIYVRDNLGKLIQTRHVHDDHESSESWEYNLHGHCTRYTDQLGVLTTFSYNYLTPGMDGARGITTEELKPNGDRVWTWQDARGYSTEFKLYSSSGELTQHKYLGYDGAGHVVFRLEECLSHGVCTSRPILTRLRFGAGDQVLERFDAKGSEDSRYRSWSYDPYGYCSSKKESSGLTHNYHYDLCGRLDHSWSSDATVDYRYVYDALDRTICIENKLTQGKTQRQYDANNRIVDEILENGLRYQREYDGLGQVTREIYPDGSQVQRLYEGGLLRSTIRTTGRVYQHAITGYDSQGRSLCEELAWGLGSIDRRYDDKGRIIHLQRPGYLATSINYDCLGRLTFRKVTDDLATTDETYLYDALSQLTSEKGKQECTYEHDSRGRRTLKDGMPIEHDCLDQLKSLGDGPMANFEYDLDGHLLSFTREGVRWNLRYDAWSRLVEVAFKDTVIHYSYDADDRCLSRAVTKPESCEEEQFGYIDRRLVTCLSHDATHHRIFIRGDSSEQGDVMAWEVDGHVHLPVLDMVGSTVGWMDEDGSFLGAWRYDAFGIVFSEPVGPWGYHSKYTDVETGFVNFGRRYYVPAWGQWLTRDPKGEIDGTNLYSFVGNNPLTSSDSWGLFSIDIERSGCSDFMDSHLHGSNSFHGFGHEGVGEFKASTNDSVCVEYTCVSKDVYRVFCPVKTINSSDKKLAGYINGSGNVLTDALLNAQFISCILGRDVALAYFDGNGLLLDCLSSLLERLGAKEVPKQAVDAVWNMYQYGTQREDVFDVIPHSRGMHAAKEVNKQYGISHEAILRQIAIYAVAGSGDIIMDNSYKSVKNAVCTKDAVIRIFDNGAIERQRANGMLIDVEPYRGKDMGPTTWFEHRLNCPTSRASLEKYKPVMEGSK